MGGSLKKTMNTQNTTPLHHGHRRFSTLRHPASETSEIQGRMESQLPTTSWYPGHQKITTPGYHLPGRELFFFCLYFFQSFKLFLLTLKQQPIKKLLKSIIRCTNTYICTIDSCLQNFLSSLFLIDSPVYNGCLGVVLKFEKLHEKSLKIKMALGNL